MAYSVITPKVQKEFDKFDSSLQKRIINGLNELSIGSENIDVKKLKGENFFRLRAGDYRVVFNYDEDKIIVVKIAHRKDIYKKR